MGPSSVSLSKMTDSNSGGSISDLVTVHYLLSAAAAAAAAPDGPDVVRLSVRTRETLRRLELKGLEASGKTNDGFPSASGEAGEKEQAERENDGVSYFTYSSSSVSSTATNVESPTPTEVQCHRLFLDSPTALDSPSVSRLVETLLLCPNESDAFKSQQQQRQKVSINSWDSRIWIPAAKAGRKVSLLYEMSLRYPEAAREADEEEILAEFSNAKVRVQRQGAQEQQLEQTWTLNPIDDQSPAATSSPTIAALIRLLPDPTTQRIYIAKLLVHPSWRRKGLARTLLRHLMTTVHGFRGWTWCWTVFAENLPAVKLYLGLPGGGAKVEKVLWVVEGESSAK